MTVSAFLRWRLPLWLPWGLMALTIGGLGAYYETNDDGLFTLLLRGPAAGAPVADLHLYFHGFGRGWAALYGRWPGLPWYGLTLYALLGAAFMLLFTVLDRAARPRLRPGPRALLLVGYYGIALLESVLWFNFGRVAVLLAGAGLLYAGQRATDPAPARRRALSLGLLATLLAGMLRPSAALLGLLAALPAITCSPAGAQKPFAKYDTGFATDPGPKPEFWTPFGRVLAWFAAVALVGALALNMLPSSPETRYRRQLDTLLAQLNDYQLRRRGPATPADALALSGATRWWLVADSAVFNPALFERATRLDGRYFAARVLPGKLAATVRLLVRDYFPLLLALLGLLGLSRRPRPAAAPPRAPRWREQLSYAGFAALLLGLGGLLKLPPRLAGPLLALFLAGQLSLALPYASAPSRQWRRLALLLGLPVLLLYAAKTAHRGQVLRHEQQVRTAFLRRLQARAGARLVVAAGLEAALKSTSPFQNAGPARVLLLTGWLPLDPSQPRYRQQLSGRRELSPAVQRLAADSAVVWLLPPAFVPFYNAYLARIAHLPAPGLRFARLPGLPAPADTALPVPVRPGRGAGPAMPVP